MSNEETHYNIETRSGEEPWRDMQYQAKHTADLIRSLAFWREAGYEARMVKVTTTTTKEVMDL